MVVAAPDDPVRSRPALEVRTVISMQARAMADRVVLVHDAPGALTTSELELEQAMVLLEQLRIAVRRVRRFRLDVAAAPSQPITVARPT